MTTAESSAPAGAQSITEHELAQCQRANKTGCTPVVFVQPGRIGWVGLCGASPKVVHQLRIHAAESIPVHGHPRLVDPGIHPVAEHRPNRLPLGRQRPRPTSTKQPWSGPPPTAACRGERRASAGRRRRSAGPGARLPPTAQHRITKPSSSWPTLRNEPTPRFFVDLEA